MSSEQQAGPARWPDHQYKSGPAGPKCERGTRCLTSIFDVRRDCSILIYRCDSCREEVWI
jgi:hypothetical protein